MKLEVSPDTLVGPMESTGNLFRWRFIFCFSSRGSPVRTVSYMTWRSLVPTYRVLFRFVGCRYPTTTFMTLFVSFLVIYSGFMYLNACKNHKLLWKFEQWHLSCHYRPWLLPHITVSFYISLLCGDLDPVVQIELILTSTQRLFPNKLNLAPTDLNTAMTQFVFFFVYSWFEHLQEPLSVIAVWIVVPTELWLIILGHGFYHTIPYLFLYLPYLFTTPAECIWCFDLSCHANH